MWHTNCGDILLHILEACSEKLSEIVWRITALCTGKAWLLTLFKISFKTKSCVHRDPQPLALFSWPPSLSLTSSVFHWLRRQSSQISTRWHTWCFSDIRGRRQALMCVILSRVKGKTLITRHGLIIYTSLVSYSVSALSKYTAAATAFQRHITKLH